MRSKKTLLNLGKGRILPSIKFARIFIFYLLFKPGQIMLKNQRQARLPLMKGMGDLYHFSYLKKANVFPEGTLINVLISNTEKYQPQMAETLFICSTLFIFPTLLADFKNRIQNQDRVPVLWAEVHIDHTTSIPLL